MALMPGCSSGSSTTDSTRRPSMNTRGCRRRSDSRYSSPVMRVAVAAGAFKGFSLARSAHSARGGHRRHQGESGGMDVPELHVLDLLFQVAPAFVQHRVRLVRQLALRT